MHGDDRRDADHLVDGCAIDRHPLGGFIVEALGGEFSHRVPNLPAAYAVIQQLAGRRDFPLDR